jgi:hypothetical protein
VIDCHYRLKGATDMTDPKDNGSSQSNNGEELPLEALDLVSGGERMDGSVVNLTIGQSPT